MTDTTTTAEILVQDTLGRVRTPREKRERILDEYERSGVCSLGRGKVFDAVLMQPFVIGIIRGMGPALAGLMMSGLHGQCPCHFFAGRPVGSRDD